MPKSRPQPPRRDRRRSICGSFSWIDHRFLREGFDQSLTRLVSRNTYSEIIPIVLSQVSTN
jgi:hypothetical protein